jgi:hypothetical protein
MTVTYQLDYEAFGEHVLRAPWMGAEMVARAERGKAFAESTAPYDAADPTLRHYRDSFYVTGTLHGGTRHDRAEGRLSNDDDAAVFVEFGNKNTEEHATLRKAMDVMRG